MFQDTKIYDQTYEEALRNDKKTASEIEEFKKELIETQECLKLNQKHLFQHAMIPLANGKALIKGKLVHTNEIFMYIGDNWFIKTSADRAIKICNRRLQKCDENLKQLEREIKRFDSNLEKSKEYAIFPNEDLKEIIEPYIEEDEKEWRRKHRENMRKYKEKERLEREAAPPVFEILGELEKEEANSSNNNPTTDSDLGNWSDEASNSETSLEESDQSSIEELSTVETHLKKRVSFSDLEDKHNYILKEPSDSKCTNIIRFKHSANKPTRILKNDNSIVSPSDLCQNFFQNSRPKSILKKESHLAEDKKYCTNFIYQNVTLNDHDEVGQIRDNPLTNVVGDITEKELDIPFNLDKATRPISQFKKSRMKNIHGHKS